MKIYFIAFLVTIFSTQILADKEDEISSEDFKYSHLKLDLIQTDDTAIGLSASLPLPGGLYIVLQRKAEGVDTSDDTYDRIINAARLGIHAGIGDIFESISSNGIKLDVKNFFDVYAELGLKSTSYETDIVSFSEDDSQANVIAGIRFGNPSGWEGNLFVDFSKDSEIKIKECPAGQVCTTLVEYELADKTDQKFGAGLQYNINKRSAVTLEMMSSKIFDSSLSLSYKLKF
jgi:hypothetical protein